MGANSTTTTQQQSAYPNMPSWLSPYYYTGSSEAQQAQANLPNLSFLYNQVPLLNTPGLSPLEWGDIGYANKAIGPNVTTGIGERGLEQFIGQNGKPSAATRAGLQEFKDLQAPEIQQQDVLMGLGNSGANAAALAQGQEQALVPLLQSDQANTLQASNAMTQTGLQQQQTTLQQLQFALESAGLPRQIATQQAQNLFNQQQGKFNYASDLQKSPLSGFQSLIGQLQNMTSTVKGPKF